MKDLLLQFVPWVIGGMFALMAYIGVRYRAIAKGREEALQDVATKTNKQAVNAAKVVRDVQDENRRLPPGAAADLLHSRWGMHKPPAGGQ